MKNFSLLMILAFSLFLIPLQSVAVFEGDDGWKLEKDKHGIKVYTRITGELKFKEYRAEVTVDAPVDRLIELIRDIERYPKWMASVKNARVLDQKDSSDFYVYTEISVPWPFSNRDQITRSVFDYDPETGAYRMTIEFVADYLPEKKGIVRMKKGNGLWVFTPVGEQKTHVVQQFAADPGGKVPAWIVNMLIVDGPYKTFLNLKAVFEP